MNAALTFEHVTKRYRGAREYRALRDDLMGTAGRLVGAKRPPRREVVALDDFSLEIPIGQSIGLIGTNGAGKTTALKIATRVAYPTEGRMRVRGRVGALIEVGSGMHPELSGRENVFLYGKILGLTQRDIARRFDEIIEFADIGHAIDRPVKQYSSGMQLRLGFSVAAHLEPDVLLVDEAIAVGDAGFQYRCVERMNEITRRGGTLIFVSHDMTAIESLCERTVLLSGGRIAADGPTREVVTSYLQSFEDGRLSSGQDVGAAGVPGTIEILRTTLHDQNGATIDTVSAGDALTVRLHYRSPSPVTRPIFNIGLADGRIGCFALASMLSDGAVPDVLHGDGVIECTFDALPLRPRTYEIWCGVRGELGYGNLLPWSRLRLFNVESPLGDGLAGVSVDMSTAPVVIPYSWRHAEDVVQSGAA